jgi:heme-degrading monooxygenase HmoA
MITVGMNYRVLPGKEKAFEDVFQAVLRVMNDMPGHTRSSLFRDVFNPSQYLIISDWNDRAAFDGFIASEAFRKVASWGKEQILAGRPTHEVYEHGE